MEGSGIGGSGGAARPPARGAIGAAAAEHRAALLALADALAAGLPEEHAGAVREIARGLRAASLRLVVTGLSDGPKSRLVNALAGRAGLLPERLPPKSAIASRLCFARPGGPESGALIEFFDAGTWAEAASGAGRLRPCLDARAREALQARIAREVEEMRNRAYMRLGEAFHQMLGQGRRIEAFTATSRATVYGGDAVGGTRGGGRGRYADLARTVEIFLEAGPFRIPAAVVDSPGFDPAFALREERTALLLEEADLCIHVMGADAPLSAAAREALGLVLGRMAGRLVVLLARSGPAAGARRVHPEALRAAVERLVAEADGGAGTPVLLDTLPPGRAAPPDALAGLCRALDERIFWGPALAAHDAAAGRLAEAARAAAAAMERDAAIIRRRYHAGGTLDAGADRVALEGALDELRRVREEARETLEAALEAPRTRLRADALQAVRAEAAALAARAIAGEAGPQDGLAAALGRRLGTLLDGLREEAEAALGTARGALLAVMEDAGVPDPLPGPAEALGDPGLRAALGPLALVEDRARDLTPSLARRMGEEAARRALSGPFVPAVESVLETASLALSQAARAALDALHAAARDALGVHAAAAEKAARLARIEESAAECRGVAARLDAFRSASRPGEG